MGKRLLTAVIGIPVGIGIMFLAGTPIFNLAIAFLAAAIVYELFNNCGFMQFKLHSVICIVYASVMPFLVQYFKSKTGVIYSFGALCMLVMLCGFIAEHKRLTYDKLCFMVASTFLTTTAMCCIVTLKEMSPIHGVCYVVICLAAAWLSDGAAYFVGTFFGKRKLCPNISPKKTVEGAVGGVIVGAAVLVAYIAVYSLVQAKRGYDFNVNYATAVLIGLVSGMLSIVGDLTASLIKRQHNIKDFGKIMPGHGGVLDRFDSVLIVAPFLALSLKYIDLFYNV